MSQESQPDSARQELDEKLEAYFSHYGLESLTASSLGEKSEQRPLDPPIGGLASRSVLGQRLVSLLTAAKGTLGRMLVRMPALHEIYLSVKLRLQGDPERSEAPVSFEKPEMKELFELALTSFLGSGDRIDLTTRGEAKVTAIIVVYNQASLLLQALRSIESVADLEVVIVDNASDHQTHQLIGRLDGIKLIENQENLGFLRAANQGAEQACGEYLLFLNSDCIVFPGAVDHAVEFAERIPGVGALGGRIINFNGRLQEAGSEVLADGSCQGIGRGERPLDHSFLWVREVDFCSGAFLFTPRDLFSRHGGFDEVYSPAYYEEVDYCVRLHEAGHRVFYVPRVSVLHYEFGSERKRGDAIRQQRLNRSVFRKRNARFLAQKAQDGPRIGQLPDTPSDLHVLVIDDQVPHVFRGGGAPRCRRMIHELSSIVKRVTFAPTFPVSEDWEGVYRALPETVEVVHPGGWPMIQRILLSGRTSYDLVIVSRPHNMRRVLPGVRWLKKRHSWRWPFIIYDAEAVFSDRDILKAKLLDDKRLLRRARAGRRKEFSLFEHADLIWAASPREAETIREQTAAATCHLGHALEPGNLAGSFSGRENFLFVGSLRDDGSPNVDSILWFVRDIWPRIRQVLPNQVELIVAGECCADSLKEIRDPSVTFVGAVDDLEALYEKSRVFVAPTRFAAGVPHKVHEAAAHGLPVVTTSLICSQLGWTHEIESLVADDSEGFADCCQRLYSSERLWRELRTNAYAAVGRDCSARTFRQTIIDSLTQATTHQ